MEQELSNDQFPSPEQLWIIYKRYKGLETDEQDAVARQIIFSADRGGHRATTSKSPSSPHRVKRHASKF